MAKSDSKRPDAASERGKVPPARILVVEDNPLNRLLVHDILELRGHEVVEASTVDEARRKLEVDRLDLLLLDVQIPGGGGEAVIREVRQRPDLADLPIIAVTSLAMPGDRERLLAALGLHGLVAGAHEVALGDLAVLEVVVDDEDRRGRLSRPVGHERRPLRS